MTGVHGSDLTCLFAMGETFADVLSQAIRASGLGLERISQHLRTQQLRCSASTLSLWQNGRAVPRRAESMRAVLALELILGLEPGRLVETLKSPAPGRPEWWRQRLPVRRDDPIQSSVEAARIEFGLPTSDALRRLNIHVVGFVDAAGRQTRTNLMQVFQAEVDGIERFLVSSYLSGVHAGAVNHVLPLAGFRLGRVREFPDIGLSVAEAIFDRQLSGGGVHAVEMDFVPWPEPPPASQPWEPYELVFSQPSGRVTLEIVFEDGDPDAVEAAVVPDGAEGYAFTPLEPFEGRVQVSTDSLTAGLLAVRWRFGGAS